MDIKTKYAAFIITYERSQILLNTIKEIFNQTLPPDKILIVDNSESDDTKNAIYSLNNKNVIYHRTGYNAGPSGGAYIGLDRMAKENYEWLFWVDDDNPPAKKDIIERIFQILPKVDTETCGQIGLVGSKFNKWTGEISRLSNDELEKDIIEVDTIGGGQCKIISKKVAKSGILPDKKLFFGFEDLDIDIKIKKAGYKSYVSGELLYESRKRSNRLTLGKANFIQTDSIALNRQYYSIRSLLTIFHHNNYISAMLYLTLKKVISIFLAYGKGLKAGNRFSKIVFLAYYHFMKGKYGKVDLNV